MRFRLPHDMPELDLGGQKFPVSEQIVDIPPELEDELRKAFPNAEEVTTDVSSEDPPTGVTDPRRKAQP